MRQTVDWLLQGDVAVQYLVHRRLLDSGASVLQQLQERIAREGRGAGLLSCRRANGHWGLHYYQTKWTCTHYTLLDLQTLSAPRTTPPCREMVTRMLDECMKADGSLNLSKSEHPSDTCVDGMALAYSAWFCPGDPRVRRLARSLLFCQKPDGGFTWDPGSDTGDAHTTICVLEGLGQCLDAGLRGLDAGLKAALARGAEFLLSKGLFMLDRDARFRRLSFPWRYRYDLLRALAFFADRRLPYDPRMRPALDWLRQKRKAEGWWTLENIHRGNVHFDLEEKGEPSRFITAKALHILRQYPR